jgi:hypothetical protein
MQHAAAAQQLLLAAMDAAAASGDVEAFQMLHEELPAVGELSAAQMVVLLQSAISQDEALSAFLVLQLLLLQGSQAVSSSCIKQLLTQAVQLRRVGAAQLLCKCQGAQGISKHSCKQLVALARNQGILHKVALLLLSLLDEVDAWLHFQAVAAAVAAGDAKAVVALAGLPPESVGGRVLWPQVQAWLADAVSEHQREMVAAMCKLQVRQPRNCPDSKGVATLLQCAAQDTHDEALRILVQEVLDSGNICSAQQAAEAVAQQMQAALKQGDVQLLRCLAGSKTAEALDACSITGLLWWTLQRQQGEAAAVLLELECAKQCVNSCKALQRAVEECKAAGVLKIAASQREVAPAAPAGQGLQLPAGAQ